MLLEFLLFAHLKVLSVKDLKVHITGNFPETLGIQDFFYLVTHKTKSEKHICFDLYFIAGNLKLSYSMFWWVFF